MEYPGKYSMYEKSMKVVWRHVGKDHSLKVRTTLDYSLVPEILAEIFTGTTLHFTVSISSVFFLGSPVHQGSFQNRLLPK